VLVLAGQVRPTPLSTAINPSLLDLPTPAKKSILDLWQQEVIDLAAHLGGCGLPMRVLVDQSTPLPQQPESAALPVSIERDPSPLRGTGGLLHDLARQSDPDSHMLVVHGPQLLTRPLAELADLLGRASADVAILSQTNDSPCGIMLIRCGVLDRVAQIGFVDFREQALPQIAKIHRVEVISLSGTAALPTRTCDGYIRALRLYAAHQRGIPLAEFDNPFAESWQTSFAIVEPGAEVHPTARIHDSVVLAGACVGHDAVVAYSVVGPGGTVPPRSALVHEVLGASRPVTDRS